MVSDCYYVKMVTMLISEAQHDKPLKRQSQLQQLTFFHLCDVIFDFHIK